MYINCVSHSAQRVWSPTLIVLKHASLQNLLELRIAHGVGSGHFAVRHSRDLAEAYDSDLIVSLVEPKLIYDGGGNGHPITLPICKYKHIQSLGLGGSAVFTKELFDLTQLCHAKSRRK